MPKKLAVYFAIFVGKLRVLMSEVEVYEVTTAADLDEFVKFPMSLYKGSKFFVPPLIKDEKNIWNIAENPALAYSEAKKYLAKKNGKTVGRIAVIFNKKEKEELGIEKIRFGWIDFEDDLEITKALLQTAINFAQEKNISKIEGPMGFTNLDKAGLLVKGYEKPATMIGIYNYPYYKEHFEKLGLKEDKKWVEFELEFPEVLPEKVVKFNEILKQKYGLKVLKFKDKKEIIPYVEPMFKLLDETYKPLSTYTPITDEQIKMYKDKYFGFIDKDYIVCIADSNEKLIAFAITMPSYSEALRKANGKLLPFGWWHLLRAGKTADRANFYLIGILPEYQRRGVTSIIFKEIFENLRKRGIKKMETNPELADNKNVQLLWQDYNPVNHKTRCTFSINLEDWKI